MLDFSSLFHLINSKVFCLHMIKFKQGPAVVWMPNLQFFSETLAFPLAPVSILLKGKSQYQLRKGLFSVQKVSNQQTSYVTDKGSNSSEQPEPSLFGGTLIRALYCIKLKGSCLQTVVDPGCQ